MSSILVTFSMFIFSFKGFSQELKEFQQIIYCTPIKSELINSLIITRVQESTDDYPYFSDRIKFKLVFADYIEVKASNQVDNQIRIRTQNRASIMEINTSYFPIKLYTPNSIWQGISHQLSFEAILDQGRYDQGKRPIELNCQSRLAQIQ